MNIDTKFRITLNSVLYARGPGLKKYYYSILEGENYHLCNEVDPNSEFEFDGYFIRRISLTELAMIKGATKILRIKDWLRHKNNGISNI